jgi:CRISPR/Cas system CMR subunit Cmr4 (Cas7 group RAMP superfamily)
MKKFSLWLMMIPPACLGGTLTLIAMWIGPPIFSDPVRLVGVGLLLLIPIFLAWVATCYVIDHIEREFWKLECKLNSEVELHDRLTQLREQTENAETEITRLTELYGSREAAIEVFYQNRQINRSGVSDPLGAQSRTKTETITKNSFFIPSS